MGRAFLRPKSVGFLLGSLVCGFNFGQSMWMMPFYLKRDLDASQVTIGAAFSAVCLSSVLALCQSGALIERVGRERVAVLCLALYAARAAAWRWLVQSPWMAVPVECLFGLAAGLWLPTMASFAAAAAPPGRKATAQAVLSAAFDGLGTSRFFTGSLSSSTDHSSPSWYIQ